MSRASIISIIAFPCLLLSSMQLAMALELTGRASAVAAYTDINRAGLLPESSNNSNQQSLRLMLDDNRAASHASVHIKFYRHESDGFSQQGAVSSDFFRATALSNKDDIYTQQEGVTYVHEVDVLRYEYNFDKARLSIGRQAIDWGVGRFWQPMNVFGVFSPTDLDTDFKPGIDAMVVDWFPDARSSLSVASVHSSSDFTTEQYNIAAHYRQQFGLRHEFSLLVAEVLANQVVGASLESDWQGIGWRLEAVHYTMDTTDEEAWFWIGGADYYFANDIFFSVELYRNALGASAEQELFAQLNNPLFVTGIQQQLSEQVLALALSQDMTPLLNLGYAIFISDLEDNISGDTHSSILQQLALRYSLGDNSDLQLALLSATGKGLDAFALPQSEFGALDKSASLRVRHYF